MMSRGGDFLVIGGGIAGLSAAAALARHGRVTVIEAEQAIGFHSSGRSAAFSHYGLGDALIRALTSFSRSFFIDPPEGFSEAPLCRTAPALFVATEAMRPELEKLHAQISLFTDSIARVGTAEMRALCPVLRLGPGAIVAGLLDRDGLRLDPDAMLQGFARALRQNGGELLTGHRIAAIRKAGADWQVESESGERWSAPVLVNAAGAWADQVARLAGVRPLGLAPLRRTMIVVDPPEGTNVRGWPFVKTVGDVFYMLPEGGRLMASPVDEIPTEPSDAQPEEVDIAVAASRVERFTTIKIRHIAHRWAGLRTFARDRHPVAGFAPDAPGFFWLAGQGGFGLQTAPAMAAAAEALITGTAWRAGLSVLGVEAEHIRPERLLAGRG